MGENIFCDLCGANIPKRDLVQQISINDKVLADACYTCANNLKMSLDSARTETVNRLTVKPEDAKAEPAPAEQPAQPQGLTPEQQAAMQPKPQPAATPPHETVPPGTPNPDKGKGGATDAN